MTDRKRYLQRLSAEMKNSPVNVVNDVLAKYITWNDRRTLISQSFELLLNL